MKKIADMFNTFVYVVTAVVFGSAVYITIFWGDSTLGVKLLWEILLVSFLCSLGTLIYPEKTVSKKVIWLLRTLHYVLVNVVVLGCGIWFEWFYADNLLMVLGMLFLIAVIFVTASFILWKRAAHTAELMNERLKTYRGEE
ncbi:MAG: DUF3021 domain-containing protein [Lachnospiraceae bacterium]|nr:DUF3021 domain-containing protein [Lachnospiraceae bacterium]